MTAVVRMPRAETRLLSAGSGGGRGGVSEKVDGKQSQNILEFYVVVVFSEQAGRSSYSAGIYSQVQG